MLPAAPDSLPPAPRAFYDELRALIAAAQPTDLDDDRVEVDFGDSGVAVTLPHAREPEWTLAAQVSRRAAVVVAGPASEHFDDRAQDWTSAAVAYMGAVLRGEHELTVTHRSPAFWRRPRVESLRIDFGARA